MRIPPPFFLLWSIKKLKCCESTSCLCSISLGDLGSRSFGLLGCSGCRRFLDGLVVQHWLSLGHVEQLCGLHDLDLRPLENDYFIRVK